MYADKSYIIRSSALSCRETLSPLTECWSSVRVDPPSDALRLEDSISDECGSREEATCRRVYLHEIFLKVQVSELAVQ